MVSIFPGATLDMFFLSGTIDLIITIIQGVKTMYKKISALKARQNLGQVMNEVALKGDDYIIERAGKPLVAVIPMEKYHSLQQEWDEFFESVSAMSASIKEKDAKIVDELVDEAVRAYRKQPRAKRQ